MGCASKICIPQADPIHYQQMIQDPTAAGTLGTVGSFVNVRCQRLDEWLCCNDRAGLKPLIFFADYECSVYGVPKTNFSPLLDLRRFFRLGYTDNTDICLLGLTIGIRRPSVPEFCQKLHSVGAVITLDAVVGFIVVEAA